ncbi:hypothetical protein JX266_014114 [Neoarthrinium moseri]|nr:hypothetical protein JX266_014114 [Neoarthrinium moseri]
MTPGGMECVRVRELGSEGLSFIRNHPDQKRISGTDPFPDYKFIGIADVWADGSGTEMRFPAIYLLLRFEGNMFWVAARSTTKRAQWFDDDETVNTYRRNRTGQLNNDSLTLTGTQSANPTSTGDDRIQDLVSTVRQRGRKSTWQRFLRGGSIARQNHRKVEVDKGHLQALWKPPFDSHPRGFFVESYRAVRLIWLLLMRSFSKYTRYYTRLSDIRGHKDTVFKTMRNKPPPIVGIEEMDGRQVVELLGLDEEGVVHNVHELAGAASGDRGRDGKGDGGLPGLVRDGAQ